MSLPDMHLRMPISFRPARQHEWRELLGREPAPSVCRSRRRCERTLRLRHRFQPGLWQYFSASVFCEQLSESILFSSRCARFVRIAKIRPYAEALLGGVYTIETAQGASKIRISFAETLAAGARLPHHTRRMLERYRHVRVEAESDGSPCYEYQKRLRHKPRHKSQLCGNSSCLTC